MCRLITIWTGCFLLLGSKVFSQDLARQKTFSTSADTLIIDSLSIVLGSVKILLPDSSLVDSLTYRLDAAAASLTWVKKPGNTTVHIHYQVFPILFTKRYSKRSPETISEELIDNRHLLKEENPDESNRLFRLEGLQKSGSISRSVGVGNNQDLALNSNMALQLAGKITDDLEIVAAISDDNIPIQPEGNTQQLNEFDKVFIQLKRRNSALTGGDFELKKPDSYFMNFYKRTQGGSFSTAFSSRNNWSYRTSISAAVAKGRSSRFSFNGTEGNQGPYRLTGNNGEQNIIVLSGTERVFVDGVLLMRGQENDYIIEYNTAEITFTAKKLITQYSRIIVEFEYSDKNYARTLAYFNQEISSEKLSFRFNYYNEQDNRNQPFLQDLSSAQKQFLKTIGNNTSLAYVPNIDTVVFQEKEILYKQVDTLQYPGVFVYSSDAKLARYRPSFSFVGAGNGNYRLSTSSTANGRVFEFVPPVADIKQGSYESVSLLITPKKQQLITFGTNYQARKNTFISSEFAFSDNDLNLFSTLGNKQNKGLAFKLSAKNQLWLTKKDTTTATRFVSSFNYETTSAGFKPLERYRPIEFERDFNLSNLPLSHREHLGTISLSLNKNLAKYIQYQFSSFLRQDIYTGFQNSLQGAYQFKNFNFFYSGKLLASASSLNDGRFFRQKVDLSRTVKLLRVGINFEQEENENFFNNKMLTGDSFSFKQYKLYLQSGDANAGSFKLEYSKRYDKLPVSDRLENYSVADLITGELVLNKSSDSRLSISSTYRDIRYMIPTKNGNENTFLGRVDYTVKMLKGLINSSVFYGIGPGREPKQEFSYLEVTTGQGAYTWNDYNNNGIRELNEFEIARYQDQARFIRIFQPTNEFINSNLKTLNYTLRLTPSAILEDENSFFKILGLFSGQTAFKIERKSSGERGLAAYNPFIRTLSENLISDNTFIRNTLFFNRNNPLFGFDVNYQVAGNKLLLINGFDTRNRKEGSLRLRGNIKKTTLTFETRYGAKRYYSELFSEKRYKIGFLELLPGINYQLNANFRYGLLASYRNQDNFINNKEKSKNYKLGSDLRYNIPRHGMLNATLNIIKNDFSGSPNSPVAYEMLEGLQSGNNLVWNTTLQKTIAQGVQMNLGYEGRKSESTQAIHTGSVQFRAFF